MSPVAHANELRVSRPRNRSASTGKLNFTEAEVSQYVSSRLPKLKRSGAEWRGPCPVHNGERDSFAVNRETGLSICHSKCGRGWSLVTLERELHGGTVGDARKRVLELIGRPQPTIVAVYDYTDEKGNLLFQAVRYVPKDFKLRRPNGSDWIWNVRNVRKVLYRLPRVSAANQVLVVEGEKDVHTLEGHDYVATCNPGGAGKWRPEFSEQLADKDVVIIPDNDHAGDRHAAKVRSSLLGRARSVRTVRLAGLPDKGDVTDWFRAGGNKEELNRQIEAAEFDRGDEHEITRPPLAGSFRNDDNGVWWQESGKQDLWVCQPLDVLASTVDFQDGNRGKLVQFRDPSGRKRQVVIPHVKLAADGNEALDSLIYLGFKLNRSRKARDHLKDYIWSAEPERTVRVVPQIGFHRGSFVLPDRTISPDGAEEILFQPADVSTDHKIRQAGSLADWQQHISRHCPGNSRLVFPVSAAFAAVMLSPMQHECAGFHLRGLSSTGKTTAVRVAGSVWGGGGEHGYLDTWRATTNGLEARAALHNNALLCLDEISQISEREVGDAIYMIGNGTAKCRMTKGITARQTMSFRLLYLSTGERSLAEMMRAAGKHARGGQELRLAEIPVDGAKEMGIFEELHDAATPGQLARQLSAASAKYYGTAIIAFLEQLVANLEAAKETVKKLQQEFVSRNVASGAAGEVYRVASTFGLVAAAGELATDCGVTGWKKGEATSAGEKCFHDWLAARGSTGPLDVARGLEEVRQFVTQHHSRFLDLHEDPSRWPNIPKPAGYRERDDPNDPDSGWNYYIHPKVFKQEVCGGYDYRAVYQAMLDRGWSRTNKGKSLPLGKKIPGVGYGRFFVVLSASLQEDEI